MSLRQMFQGSIVKPGFNPLGTQTPTYTYNLYAWGYNLNGQLGLGNITSYSSPKQVGSLTDWVTLTASYNNALAVKTNGTLWAWGYNGKGNLGLLNLISYSSPVQVGALTNWSKISSGGGPGLAFSLAIKTDGTLWAWGDNQQGQLGLGNVTAYSSPKQIGSGTTWSSISAGYAWCMATKTDGTLWSWGFNIYGNLGIGNVTYKSSPVQVGALTTWSKISAASGGLSAAAIKTDGTLWTWGYNGSGELGLGNVTNYSSPKQVGALTNWANISAGSASFKLAIKTNGTLWSWGRNDSGQLGLGNTTYYSSPKQIGSLTTWVTPQCGDSHAVVNKTDGTLWTWGSNMFGTLGLGNTVNRSSPNQIGALTTWLVFAGGSYNTYALAY